MIHQLRGIPRLRHVIGNEFREVSEFVQRRPRVCLCVVVILTVTLGNFRAGIITFDSGQDLPYGSGGFHRSSRLSKTDDVKHGGIYFFEFSNGSQEIHAKQLCAFESAAKHHPDLPVFVTVEDPKRYSDCLTKSLLEKYRKIQIVTMNRRAWLKAHIPPTQPEAGSGLEKLSEAEDPAQFSDYIRYVTLYERGGIYLDSDVIVLRSLNGIKNALGLQAKDVVNQAVVVFDKGHAFLLQCILEFQKTFDPGNRESGGGHLVTRLAKEMWCPKEVFPARDGNRTIRCSGGLSLLPVHAAYPVPREAWATLFQDDHDGQGRSDGSSNNSSRDLLLMDRINRDSLVVHMWNHESRHAEINATSETRQVAARLAAEHCPTVFGFLKQLKSGWTRGPPLTECP